MAKESSNKNNSVAEKVTIKNMITSDLARSGLVSSDAALMKIEPLTKHMMLDCVGVNTIGYKIPYFTINKKVMDFYRVRFLEDPSKFGKSKKPQKYSQVKGSPNHLYFPPQTKWASIAKDVDVPIMITEGEKKAAKACKEGLPCIGLGGVWSFRSKKQNTFFISDFNLIKWSQRTVTLMFDSDLKTNSNVLAALNCLAHELTKKGALVLIGFLPQEEDGNKIGLDDYLVQNSAEALKTDVPIEQFAESVDLWKLNSEIAYIDNVSAIYHFKTMQLIKPQTLHEFYADRTIAREVRGDLKIIPLTKEWMTWPKKRRSPKLVYSPGSDKALDDGSINLWTGWGLEPKKGDITPWVNFVNYFFIEDPAFFKWFEKWCAYPIQNPGAKLYTSVLLWGVAQGTGKSFIGYILGKIYGDNFREISQEDIHSNFNEWASGKQFILGDEITGSDKRRDSDKIKGLITRKKISINKKFTPPYEIDDTINYLFTSQHPDAMFLENSDRRMAVFECPSQKPSDKIVSDLDAWYHSEHGVAALFWYLQNQVDCSDFNPTKEAFVNKSKEQMKVLSRGDLDEFVNTIKEDAEHVLVHASLKIDRDLFTSSELLSIYDPEHLKKTSSVAMGKALSRAGFKNYMTKTELGMKRLWAMRNVEIWAKSDYQQRVANYDNSVVFTHQAKPSKYKGLKVVY